MRNITKSWKIAIIVATVVVLGTAGAAGGIAYAYANKFYPGVKVSGIALGGLSKQEGEQKVIAKANQYVSHEFKIVVPDSSKPIAGSPNQYEQKEILATGKDLGLAFNTDNAIQGAWNKGHVKDVPAWLKDAVPTIAKGHVQPLTYYVDKKTLQAFITTNVLPTTGAPIPAKIVLQNNEVTVQSPQPGFSVDAAILEASLIKSMENASDSDVTYVKAPITIAESAITRQAVTPVAEKWKALGSATVAFKIDDATTVKPTKAQLLTWFSPVQNDKEQVSLVLSQDEISKYLKTQPKIDSAKSLSAVVKSMTTLLNATSMADLQKPVTVAVVPKPVKQTTPDEFTPNKYVGKYVEVDLSSQKLYLVDSDHLVKSYTVSSGKWSTPTPPGEYKINNKARRPLSRAYGLYMPYWQDFLNGEYGLHELPEWPNGYKEGENHLGTPVSHGCVRLGVGDAKEVYDWTEIGTPVSIHS